MNWTEQIRLIATLLLYNLIVCYQKPNVKSLTRRKSRLACARVLIKQMHCYSVILRIQTLSMNVHAIVWMVVWQMNDCRGSIWQNSSQIFEARDRQNNLLALNFNRYEAKIYLKITLNEICNKYGWAALFLLHNYMSYINMRVHWYNFRLLKRI